MSEALTGPEQRKLNDLETVIELGQKTFVEVGAALAIIREQRLHRATHESFEDYCRERWGWNDRRASQLIQASEVVRSISTIVETPPANEAQARELVSVPEERRAEVWKEASKNGHPTAKEVRRVRQAVGATRQGPAIEDLEKKARELMAAGAFIEDASANGLGRQTYKKARDIILLAEDEGLLPADRAIARSALECMRESGQVAAWESVRELVERRFGSLKGGPKGAAKEPADAAARQIALFERAAHAVVTACANVPRIVVPYLPADKALEWNEALSQAVADIRSLQQQVRKYIP